MTLHLPETTHPNRVVVAMSGGVDSSVTAALLVEQGYEVIGMMMRLWSEPGCDANAPANRCCTPDQMADAQRVADQLGVPFYVIDVQQHFRDTIVQFFIDQHALGRTPNPCLECNRQIRFTHLLNQALALDANYLATGHYARIQHSTDGYRLLKGVDAAKDQAYVLHMLTQKHLAHVLFPVGEYTKTEVRQLAQQFKLPVAAKAESQDLCFLGDGDYRRFLREYSPETAVPGPILDSSGKELGQHHGLPAYTIGQRKGLGISTPQPVFVLCKDIKQNAIIVGSREELSQQALIAREVNWISGSPPPPAQIVDVKIRYKAQPAPAKIEKVANGRFRVKFQYPVFAVTAGQGVVFFDGDHCLGGGVIADQQPTTSNQPPATIYKETI